VIFSHKEIGFHFDFHQHSFFLMTRQEFVRLPILFFYTGTPAAQQITSRGYTARITPKKRKRGRPPKNRRWVVEGTHSWLNRFRELLVRYEKLVESYEALVCLAAAIICWRKIVAIYG
jgi:transposase